METYEKHNDQARCLTPRRRELLRKMILDNGWWINMEAGRTKSPSFNRSGELSDLNEFREAFGGIVPRELTIMNSRQGPYNWRPFQSNVEQFLLMLHEVINELDPRGRAKYVREALRFFGWTFE